MHSMKHIYFGITFFILFTTKLFGQSYVQLSGDFKCGVSKYYSIYATPEDVALLKTFVERCDDIEHIRIKGFKAGEHWEELFNILSNYKKLKGIELFYNDGLNKLPKNIKKNPYLRTISIVGNKQLNYDDLFKKLSHLDSLTNISLVDNKLKVIPKSFKKLKQLKSLHVSGNEGLNYEQLVEQLGESNIEELSIPLNSLSEIPENIKNLKELKVLDIRQNYIAELPNSISELDSLKDFKSEDNIFLNVNEELSKLKGLNIKYLSFDNVEDDDLASIKTIFPNATLGEKENPNNGQEQSNTNNQAQSGDDFNPLNLKEAQLCEKAIKQYNTIFKKRNNYTNYDSLGFFERLSNRKYSYNDKILADGRFEGVPLMSHNSIWPSNNVNYPRYRTKKGEIAFSICPDGNLYPELKAFNGMLWVYVGDKNKKNFKKTFVNGKTWKDVYLEYDESNETFFIVLKGEYVEKIPAYPRYVNPQSSLKLAKLHYGKKFQMYEKRLELRSERFDKEVERQKIKAQLRKQKIENQNWVRLKKYMCSHEKRLSRSGWLEYKSFLVNKKHAPLDTLAFNIEALPTSAKVRYIPCKTITPDGGDNFKNAIKGKYALNIRQSAGEQLKTQVVVYYPDREELNVFNNGFEGSVEVNNNLNYIVGFVKGDLLCFYTKKEFSEEVNSVFSPKGAIDFVVGKTFRYYNLKSFWELLESFN